MKFCFSIGSIDKNIIYILIGGIFRFLVHMFFQDIILSEFIDHPVIMNLSISIGLSLALIPSIIYKIRNKEIICCQKNEKNEENQEKTELVYINLYEELIYGRYKWILFSCIIDYSQIFIVNAFCNTCRVHMWIFDILFISFFSYFIFDFKLYIHHYISMIAIIIIGIFLDIYLENFIFNDTKDILSTIFKFISEIFLSLGIVIDKYIMEIKFCSPFEICFYHGFFGVIISLILLTFAAPINLDNVFEFFENPSFEKFYGFIIIMIVQLIYNLFILVVIKNTTTCHILIILVIAQFAPYIKGFTDTDIIDEYIILSISFLLIFLFSLIFNEIIEVNCCGLQLNTKKNIALRAKKDRISEYESESDNDDIENNRINTE